MASRTLVTIEQFDPLGDRDDIRFELDEGELIEVPSPNFEHQYVRGHLCSALNDFIRQRGLACLARTGVEFRLGDTTVRRPDVSFFDANQTARIDWRFTAASAPRSAQATF